MGKHQVFVATLCAIAGAVASISHAEVVHGFQSLDPVSLAYYDNWSHDAFDFATQAIVRNDSPAADLIYGENEKSDGWWFQLLYCKGAFVNEPLDSLRSAPDGLHNFGGAGISVGSTVVVKTAENIFAKFAVRHVYDGINGNGGCCNVVIEYYVQTDGSPSFGPSVAVDPTSWGRIKALFR